MKLYKKLFAVLLSAALLLSLAFGAVSAEAVRTMPEVPDGYDGYVVVDFEAFVLGWGYIIEPTLVPFHEGESLADVTVRLFEIAGVPETEAKEALRLAQHKLPLRCKIIRKEEAGESNEG